MLQEFQFYLVSSFIYKILAPIPYYRLSIDLLWITGHVEDIVGILFTYIYLLQKSGVNKWIFDEVFGFHNLNSLAIFMCFFIVLSNLKHYNLRGNFDTMMEVFVNIILSS